MDSTSPSFGMSRQFQIYQEGMSQKPPNIPISLEELEQAAQKVLPAQAFGYVAGGAGAELTMAGNLRAFQRWLIVPRMMRDISRRDLSVDLLGHRFPVPILLAPIGVLGICHPEGELAVARAAARLKVPMILSTVSSRTLEEVAESSATNPRWFQLYWGNHADLMASLLHRAEVAGYSALVVTLDTKLLAWRERDLQQAYLPFLFGVGMANYLSDPIFRAELGESPEANPSAAIQAFLRIFSNLTITWKDIAFLRKHTTMPILLKGILHPEDARLALDHGIDGVIVSNHGGRQMDGAIAALDALPGVVDVIAGRVPVLFDSGIRRGADIFKALALGAKAVLMGRPYVYGLSLAGEEGVREVLENLLADLDLTLALSGHVRLEELSRECLARLENCQ